MADRVVSYDFRGKFTNLTAGLATASKGVADLGGKLTELDKNGARMRAGLDTLGGAAGKLGLVAAAGLGAAVVASANFDQAMSNVQAATHETARNMDLLREAAQQAGADTAFSATEAAAGVEELAKAGISTADILGGGLTGALDLAAAGGLDVASAAEISATALTQFKLAGEDVAHVADLLAAGAGKAQGSVEDMGMALKQSGLVAAQTGLSIEETTGTLAAFASAGLVGSDAGTSFKTMLQSLTPTGDKAREAMEKLGITAYDAQGNFVGMTEFAASLEAGLANLSVEQQNAAMKTIFGSDAVRAASVIFEQGADGIQEWIDKTNDAGYAAETAATRMDNLRGDLEAFMGSLETALIGTGDGAQGPLRDLVQGATDAVNVFNDLPGPVKSATAAMLGLTAVFGGGLWFTSKVIGGIASTKTALTNLGLSADKASGALRGVAKAGAGLTSLALASAALDALRDKASGSVPEIEAVTEALLNLQDVEFASQFDGIGDAIDRLNSGGWDSFLDKINETGDKIPFIGSGLTTGLTFMAGLGPQAAEAGIEVERLNKQFEGLDAALAGLVTSGGASKAEETFTQLAAAQGLTAEEQEKLLTLLPQYEAALTGASNEVTLASGETRKLGGAAELLLGPLGELPGATDKAANAASKAAAKQRQHAEALKASRKAADETAQQFIELGNGLDNAKLSLSGWLKQLEKQAEALRNFRLNAEKAAENGLRRGLIAALQEMGPAGALRMKQLANATDEQIARANKAWQRGQDEIERYVDAIGGIPKDYTTKVHAETKQALAALGSVRTFIASINDKDVTIRVHTVRTGDGGADYVSGAGSSSTPRPAHPGKSSRMTTPVEVAGKAGAGLASVTAITAARSFQTAAASMDRVAKAADDVEYGFNKVGDSVLKELKQRERLLEKELRHAEKRMQAELDNLKELKGAWRDLRDSVSSNFMTSLWQEVDLAESLRTGLVDTDGLFAFMQAQGATGAPTAELVQAYLDSLTPDQIAALQGQAQSGLLQQDTADAAAFQAVLEELVALGFDGGAFAELAASGNLAQAEWLAQQGADYIDQLEQQYDLRNSTAIQAGVYAANSELRDEIRHQTKVFEKAQENYRETNQELKQLNRRINHLEKLAEKNPKETGQETAKALDGAASKAARNA